MSIMPIALLESFIRKGLPTLNTDPYLNPQDGLFTEAEVQAAKELVHTLDEDLAIQSHCFKLFVDLEGEKLWVTYVIYEPTFGLTLSGYREPDFDRHEEGCDYPLELTGHERVLISQILAEVDDGTPTP